MQRESVNLHHTLPNPDVPFVQSYWNGRKYGLFPVFLPSCDLMCPLSSNSQSPARYFHQCWPSQRCSWFQSCIFVSPAPSRGTGVSQQHHLVPRPSETGTDKLLVELPLALKRSYQVFLRILVCRFGVVKCCAIVRCIVSRHQRSRSLHC